MVEQTIGRVAHRADERQLVGDLREFWHDLREVYTGDLGGNRLKRAFDIVRYVFLRIPKIEVAGTPLQVKQNDTLSLVPAGPAIGAACRMRIFLGFLRSGLALQNAGQRKAKHRRAADSEHVTTRYAQMPIAQILAGLSGY